MSGEERAAALAMALSRCMNALGLMAAPGAWSQAAAGAEDLPSGCLAAIDEAMDSFSATDGPAELLTGPIDLAALLPALERVRDAASGWTSGPPPAPAIAAAREALEALGVPEPEGGWPGFQLDDP